MSERGSFCTEYIYCLHCAEAIAEHVDETDGVEFVTPVKSNDVILIVAAKMHGGFENEELMLGEEIADALGKHLCAGDSVRFAILADAGGQAFFVARGPHNDTRPDWMPCRCAECDHARAEVTR